MSRFILIEILEPASEVGPIAAFFSFLMILPFWASGYQMYLFHDTQTVTDFWSFIGAWYWYIIVWPFTVFGWFWLLILIAMAIGVFGYYAEEMENKVVDVIIVGFICALIIPVLLVAVALIRVAFS